MTPSLPSPVPPRLKRVLFVCIGNCIRSQMAEGFARTYGRDVMEPSSAGVSPAGYVSEIALKVMGERGISISGQYSKELHEAPGAPFDLIINMSGSAIPTHGLGRVVRTWTVADPMGKKEASFQTVAQQIENLVMQLVLELRMMQQGQKQASKQATTPATIGRQMPPGRR